MNKEIQTNYALAGLYITMSVAMLYMSSVTLYKILTTSGVM